MCYTNKVDLIWLIWDLLSVSKKVSFYGSIYSNLHVFPCFIWAFCPTKLFEHNMFFSENLVVGIYRNQQELNDWFSWITAKWKEVWSHMLSCMAPDTNGWLTFSLFHLFPPSHIFMAKVTQRTEQDTVVTVYSILKKLHKLWMDERVQLNILLSLLSPPSLPPRFTFSTCLLNPSLQSVNTNASP